MTAAVEIDLWSGPAPGSEQWTQQEQEMVLDPSSTMRFLRNVVRPSMLQFLPKPELDTGVAMVICPGGAFHLLGIQHEGIDVALWLADQGIAAYVLKYRLVPTPLADEAAMALVAQLMQGSESERAKSLAVVETYATHAYADAARALTILREGGSPARLGIMGFSAGGRVALETATYDDTRSRPDFIVAIYPAICAQSAVGADASPLFLVSANDDLCSPETLDAHAAWRHAHAPVELHVYQQGGHGFGIQKQGMPIDAWPTRMLEWLNAMVTSLAPTDGAPHVFPL